MLFFKFILKFEFINFEYFKKKVDRIMALSSILDTFTDIFSSVTINNIQ